MRRGEIRDPSGREEAKSGLSVLDCCCPERGGEGGGGAEGREEEGEEGGGMCCCERVGGLRSGGGRRGGEKLRVDGETGFDELDGRRSGRCGGRGVGG